MGIGNAYFTQNFWYFTIETNIFCMILSLILIVNNIVEMSGKQTGLTENKVFCLFRIMITFFITITGLVYWFVLTPMSMAQGVKFVDLLDATNLLHHFVVPVMSVVEYMVFAQKGKIRYRDCFYFLIYPLIYCGIVNLRVVCGGSAFAGGDSLYPYFFLDPDFNSQGWGMVALYIVILLVAFLLLALLYIFIDKSLFKKAERKRKENKDFEM